MRRLTEARGARLSLHETDAEALRGCDFRCADRQAVPTRTLAPEPAPAQRADKDGSRQDGNRLHAVKALLVATLA